MRKNKDGFTLIELMIVIAIIAIIAAIAIPGLLSSQRASNERSASASLKTLATAEADFRANDRDSNKIQDFWTVDVSGLYGLAPVGSGELIKLIEISVAGADYVSLVTTTTTPITAGAIQIADLTGYSVRSPKAGYWFKALLTDEAITGALYAQATNGVIDAAAATINTNQYYNFGKFAFMTFPDSFSSGRNAFFMNENNTIFKRPLNGPCKSVSSLPGTEPTFLTGTAGLIGSLSPNEWPNDTELKASYSKVD